MTNPIEQEESSEKNVIRRFERVRVTGAAPSQMVKTMIVLTALLQTRF
jgi:hypothetical protein